MGEEDVQERRREDTVGDWALCSIQVSSLFFSPIHPLFIWSDSSLSFLSLPHSIKVMMNLQFLLGTERTDSPHNRPTDEGWYVNLGGDGGMPKQDGKCVHLLTLDQ